MPKDSKAIATISNARRALQRARTIKDTVKVVDMMAGCTYLCKKAHLGFDTVLDAAVVKLDAERQAGGMLAKLIKSKGGRGKTGDNLSLVLGTESNTKAKQLSSRWQKEGSVGKREYRSYLKDCEDERREPTSAGLIAVASELEKAKRRKKIKSMAKQSALKGRYGVIYADPPWQYQQSGVRGNAEDQYPTMTVEEICEFQDSGRTIEEIANDDAVLFLWATNPLCMEALTVIEAWGFEYKTNICWVKNTFGTGFYVRSKHELLMIATRGSLLPEELSESVVEADNEGHSKKPDVFAELIVSMYPEMTYVEFFARNKRQGWISRGLEVEE